MKYTRMSEMEKGRIRGLREAGKSFSEIGRIMGRSDKSIAMWWNRQIAHGNMKTLPRALPRATNVEEDQRIVDAARRDPFTSLTKIIAETQLTCSKSTVKRRLLAAGLKTRGAEKEEKVRKRKKQTQHDNRKTVSDEISEIKIEVESSEDKGECSQNYMKEVVAKQKNNCNEDSDQPMNVLETPEIKFEVEEHGIKQELLQEDLIGAAPNFDSDVNVDNWSLTLINEDRRTFDTSSNKTISLSTEWNGSEFIKCESAYDGNIYNSDALQENPMNVQHNPSNDVVTQNLRLINENCATFGTASYGTSILDSEGKENPRRSADEMRTCPRCKFVF